MSQVPSKSPTLPVLYSFATVSEVGTALGDFVINAQRDALSKGGNFRIAISGGSLPKTLGQGLSGRTDVEWAKWEVFFADERLVPLAHEDSNFKANYDALFSKVPIPRENIHTIDESLIGNPEDCADEYEKQMINTFVGKSSIAFPRFDLILLGIGPDGHTCSLFPGHPLLEENDGWVAYLTDSPKPPPTRITLTYPVLNHAQRVAFVSTGEGKKDIMKTVLDHPEEGLPCSKVKVISPGRVYYFSDDKATELVTYPKSEFKL